MDGIMMLINIDWLDSGANTATIEMLFKMKANFCDKCDIQTAQDYWFYIKKETVVLEVIIDLSLNEWMDEASPIHVNFPTF